jgi:UDP-N-acetylglucosamine--N-acetylmuramyl-(pentapeptide) pyrophosphoryl-undecaprenol N-acetylglucosamine transferase
MYLALTGGGTAGHVTPNLALIEHFPTQKFIYIGSKSEIEKSLLSNISNVTFKTISTGKLRRYFDFQNFVDLFKVPLGIIQSVIILNKYKPKLLFSKGGYVSLPPENDAYILGIPIIIHESDSMPGLATKIASRFADEIWASYSTIQNYFPDKKVKQVLLPVRNFLKSGDPNYFKFEDSNKKTLLVMGGSLGASALNDFVFGNFQKIISDFNVIHICGNKKANPSYFSKGKYVQFEYLNQELAHAYAASYYILSRSGASALNEILALNKPAVLVPLPTTKSRGEQIANAQLAEKEGNCKVLLEENLNYLNFIDQINQLDTISSKSTILPANLDLLFAKYTK